MLEPYSEGTVNVVAGSDTITGNNTYWAKQIRTGDKISVDHDVWYIVTAVNSDTEIKIDVAYLGATAQAKAYIIARDSAQWGMNAAISADVASLMKTYKLGLQAPIDQVAEMKQDVIALKDEAVEAKTDAQTARQTAVSAAGTSTQAKDAAIDAKNEAVAAKTAAEVAKTGAETAKSGAVTAKDAAETAKTAALSAKDVAVTAKTAAETAAISSANSQDAAATSASVSADSSAASESAKNDAVAAKEAAENAKTAAVAAKDAAVSAKTTAETAKDAAGIAANAAIAGATAAETARDIATIKASEAAASAANAVNSAAAAAQSAADAAATVPEATETVKGVVELATPAEVLAGEDDERAVTVKDLDYSYATIDSDRIYEGVDLETKFAAEIAGYSDVWAWIKARITGVDYSGLHVGDYVPFVMNGNAIKAQIAGIDTYYRTGDVEIGHHIDFISKDCYPTPVPWNTTGTNNGNATNAAPWMVCNLKNVINTTWYNSLPAPLKAQIIEKRAYIETRYASGSTLTDSTGTAWNNIGKLWVPSEGEVYGTAHWGTKGYSSMQNAEYPIFAASWRNRIKGVGDGGPMCDWWLLSVKGGVSTSVCIVNSSGLAGYCYASGATVCAPVCFRIG